MNYPKIDFEDALALRSYYKRDMQASIKSLEGVPPGTYPSTEWCIGHSRRRWAHWEAVIDADLYEIMPYHPDFSVPEWRAAAECGNNGAAF